jgi:arylsulfatase A-like enzyme
MNRSLLIVLSILTVVLSTNSSSAERPPNILFILADDVGREVLGCYGGESYRTPHLDGLARSGLTFQHCYSMPVCHPTRVCLLTGLYPFQLNNPKWGSFPAEYEKQTVAQLLKSSGYETAISGKWQLTLLGKDRSHPQRLGFNESCLFGWHEGPRYFDPLIWQNGEQRADTDGAYGPDIYVEFLLDFMARNKDKPFFAFYSMALCHDVTDDLDDPVPLGPKGRYENYLEMAESMDRQIGKLVAGLDQLGLRENTLIFFTADNGTPKTFIATAEGSKLVRKPVVSQQAGRSVPGGKGELTDLGTRVPTIASWPGVVPADSETDALVDFIDILPTFVRLAGSKQPAGQVHSRSFDDVLRQPERSSRPWVFCERGKRYWVRTAEWKLYSDGSYFRMSSDPLENSPLDTTALRGAGLKAHRLLQAATKELIRDQ